MAAVWGPFEAPVLLLRCLLLLQISAIGMTNGGAVSNSIAAKDPNSLQINKGEVSTEEAKTYLSTQFPETVFSSEVTTEKARNYSTTRSPETVSSSEVTTEEARNYLTTRSPETVSSSEVTTEEARDYLSTQFPETVSSGFEEFAQDVNYTTQNATSDPVNNEGITKQKKDVLGMVMEPIFFSTGIVGNSLAIRVLLGKGFRVLPVSLTLVCLAISDMTVTVMHPFNRPFFRDLIQLDIRSINGEAGCKLFFWVWKTAKMTSSWFVVFVCIERFIVVWLPLKIKQISTRRHTICGLILIYVGIGSFNGVWTFASGLKNGKTCVPDLKVKGFEDMTKVFLYCGTTLYSGLPSVIMVIFTTLTTSRLLVSRRERQKLSGDSNLSDSATSKVTAMLIGITIAYILLVNPHAILHNIAYASGADFFESSDPIIKTGREIAQVLEQINYSINFFLYILCSTQFRRRTAEVLGLRGCKQISYIRKPSNATRNTGLSQSAS